MWRLFGRREPEPSKVERFVQREFAEAIAFCEREWTGYERHFVHVMPDFIERFSLEERLTGFVNGPIFTDLEANFPRVREMANDMYRVTGDPNGQRMILEIILMEALVRAGQSRTALREIRG